MRVGNVHFARLDLHPLEDPDRARIEAELVANADRYGVVTARIHVDIWVADNPSLDVLRLRVLDAVLRGFALDHTSRARVDATWSEAANA